MVLRDGYTPRMIHDGPSSNAGRRFSRLLVVLPDSGQWPESAKPYTLSSLATFLDKRDTLAPAVGQSCDCLTSPECPETTRFGLPAREKPCRGLGQLVLMSGWRTCWQQEGSAVNYLSQLQRGTPSQVYTISGLNDWPAGAAVRLKSHVSQALQAWLTLRVKMSDAVLG